jgi:hypothetical protein
MKRTVVKRLHGCDDEKRIRAQLRMAGTDHEEVGGADPA